MATYIERYDMMANADFKKQVAIACLVAADQIRAEAENTPNHVNRLIWANWFMTMDAVVGANVMLQRMVLSTASNPTLQEAAPAGPWSDGDIQFVVNGFIDLQANG